MVYLDKLTEEERKEYLSLKEEDRKTNSKLFEIANRLRELERKSNECNYNGEYLRIVDIHSPNYYSYMHCENTLVRTNGMLYLTGEGFQYEKNKVGGINFFTYEVNISDECGPSDVEIISKKTYVSEYKKIVNKLPSLINED